MEIARVLKRSLPWACAAALMAAGVGLVAAMKPPDVVTIVAVGDIMLSRNVAARMRDADDPLLPFRNVSALLDSSDLNFGNLEAPLSPPRPEPAGSRWDGIFGGKSLVFAAPTPSLDALLRYNFGVLALANNHAMDQGEAGLAHTLRTLAANRIAAVGAGSTLGEAWHARVVQRKAETIAFLAASYASLNYGSDETNDYVARIQDLARLRAAVQALKRQSAFVVVAMHAGEEYTAEPDPAQVAFAHAAAEAGADVVIGSHPHWLQPVERYRDALIFYSLGNFVFDLDSSPATREGAAVKLSVSNGRLLNAEIIPVEIENSCCPRPARRDEVAGALRRMRVASTRIGPWSRTTAP